MGSSRLRVRVRHVVALRIDSALGLDHPTFAREARRLRDAARRAGDAEFVQLVGETMEVRRYQETGVVTSPQALPRLEVFAAWRNSESLTHVDVMVIGWPQPP